MMDAGVGHAAVAAIVNRDLHRRQYFRSELQGKLLRPKCPKHVVFAFAFVVVVIVVVVVVVVVAAVISSLRRH